MRTLTALLACFALACGGSITGGGSPSLDGEWSGTSESGVDFELTLEEAGGVITGSGAITSGDSPIRLDVAGQYEGPEFSMTFESAPLADVDYSGRVVSDTRMEGSLLGSGFGSAGLVLVKQ
jgi:hypothetical protein